jgi:hypothetical protein
MPAQKKPVSKVSAKVEAPAKKRHKRRVETFSIYIYKVLK